MVVCLTNVFHGMGTDLSRCKFNDRKGRPLYAEVFWCLVNSNACGSQILFGHLGVLW